MILIFTLLSSLTLDCFAGGHFTKSKDAAFEAWLGSEAEVSIHHLIKNISPPGAARGAVMASPSQKNPNYYYHWVRDAALVMDVVLDLLKKTDRLADQVGGLTDEQSIERELLNKMMVDFVYFSRVNQLTPNLSGGLGEPKFNMDGSSFDEIWGRPQNDSPALRAITLTRYANFLLDEGRRFEPWVRRVLYDGNMPTASVIKADLEFVSHHWREVGFDLWEEVEGDHFYTRIVQRRALIDGAFLAERMGDPGAAGWYRLQAGLMEHEIKKHWNPHSHYILSTLNYRDRKGKVSNMDVSVILAALHGETQDGFFGPDHDWVLASADRLRKTFTQVYAINHGPDLPPAIAPAIGRYPEDVYEGGNPWVLATAAFAELHYRVAKTWKNTGVVEVTEENLPFIKFAVAGRFPLYVGKVFSTGESEFDLLLYQMRETGDQYLRRVRSHTPQDGGLSEQINRYQGFMQGAYDLSWSYGSFLTAFWSRIALENAVWTYKGDSILESVWARDYALSFDLDRVFFAVSSSY